MDHIIEYGKYQVSSENIEHTFFKFYYLTQNIDPCTLQRIILPYSHTFRLSIEMSCDAFDDLFYVSEIRKKSHEAKSGELGGWGTEQILSTKLVN